jgi:hypothetical protein
MLAIVLVPPFHLSPVPSAPDAVTHPAGNLVARQLGHLPRALTVAVGSGYASMFTGARHSKRPVMQITRAAEAIFE